MLGKAVRSIVMTTVVASGLIAGPVIYEPFADPDATLPGNTPGLGLSGTWSGDANYTVVSGSNLNWGVLVTESNYVDMVSGQAGVNCLIGNDLVNAGLLDDGSNLWFSMVIDTPSQGGINPDTAFAFGTSAVGSGNGMTLGGEAFGWSIKNDVLYASSWNLDDGNTVERGTGVSVSRDAVYFIVGEIIWGADSNAVDTLNLYLPEPTELEIGVVRGTRSRVLDQSLFDTISFGLKSNASFEIDEIRFGATYEDVAVLPPPKGTVITLY